MATWMCFVRSVGMGSRMACRMHSMKLTDMGTDVVSDSVGSMGGAMSEIAQQPSYNEVYEPNQEASHKHK